MQGWVVFKVADHKIKWKVCIGSQNTILDSDKIVWKHLAVGMPSLLFLCILSLFLDIFNDTMHFRCHVLTSRQLYVMWYCLHSFIQDSTTQAAKETSPKTSWSQYNQQLTIMHVYVGITNSIEVVLYLYWVSKWQWFLLSYLACWCKKNCSNWSAILWWFRGYLILFTHTQN